MAVSITETETKYETTERLDLDVLRRVPGVADARVEGEHELRAEYYDTADLSLIRAGITLRRRTGGSDAGWHLKLPAGPQTRQEIRLPLGDAAGRVPAELADLVQARARGRRLLRVATVITMRRTITLADDAGRSLAEVADDEVSGLRDNDLASVTVWREVEVELTGGSRHLLAAADRVLQRAGLRSAGYAAKLERVLGVADVAAQPAPELSRSAPGPQLVTAYLRQYEHALVTMDPMVRRREPDAVHQMRVATRRLRSTLRTFGAIVNDSDTADVAAELRWLGGVLGHARDAEVQARRMSGYAHHTDVEQLLGPVQARIQAHFARAAAAAMDGVMAALRSQRYYALLDRLDAVIADPPPGRDAGVPARVSVPAAVRRSYRRTRRRMRSAWRTPPGPARDAALHQARKAAKQVRYAAEAAAPVAGGDASRLARRMKKVQTILGDHQDTVVGRGLARELAIEAHAAGEPTFSYGLFYEQDACRARQLEARARQAWQQASRRRLRRWLRP
jgi:CHAD domain-containing protein